MRDSIPKAPEYRRTPKRKRLMERSITANVLECGAAAPLLNRLVESKMIAFQLSTSDSHSVPQLATSWPHAPTHRLSESGTYFVTASTYLKAHHFSTPRRLDSLQRALLGVACDFSWELEAWAVFSNHYHFVAHPSSHLDDASSLSQMLGMLHARTARWLNGLDEMPARKGWHNFWDTKLSYQKSY